MSISFDINQFNEVVIYENGRINHSAHSRRDATELELQQAAEIEALQSQIDSLQQRVHLCAGYDKLVEENAYLKSELDRLKGFRDGVIEK